MTTHDEKQGRKNQDLIDRYIAAVQRRLPAKDAADIGSELREAIASRLEETESKLGRPAELKEVGEIIRSFGSPMVSAARYTGATHLIGPDVYPYFWPVQRIVVASTVALAIVGFLVRGVLSDNPMQFVWQGWGAAMTAAWVSFAITTVVFIALDRGKAGAQIEATWIPEMLPRDTHGKPKSLFESVFSLAWDAIFIAWWIGLFKLPASINTGDEQLSVTFNAAAWSAMFWPVLALSAFSVAMHAADILHPTWTRLRAAVSILIGGISLWVVWMLSQSGQLFFVEGSPAERVAALNETFEIIAKLSLLGIAVGFAIAIALELWRLARGLRPNSQPALA